MAYQPNSSLTGMINGPGCLSIDWMLFLSRRWATRCAMVRLKSAADA